ncbi:ExbD/TolR family protein [Salinisphaera hydrothermalis]|uniref:Biopolymer transport protein ExbD/TolR n=1 Tax=Salinisphaera hydrothermalis (strain C41B8) TaxID=1304275 RepID=A0A084INT5_SALHC|nr:biopolymer transporter ExbD [Salinisphaera hydrothermalis]KEZ78369.1 Biopolymer transport protein ExbD/TolR [Salinisphaera hydrothermalis C41B8]
MTPSSTAALSFRRTDRRRRARLIGLTPLIDVVFILLLFFMLAYNLTNEHRITLDTASGSAPAHGIVGALLVEVRTDGVRYAGHYVPMKTLIARVTAARRGHPDRRVLVRSGNGVTLQDTVRVLDALSQAGVQDISLMNTAAAAGGPAS